MPSARWMVGDGVVSSPFRPVVRSARAAGRFPFRGMDGEGAVSSHFVVRSPAGKDGETINETMREGLAG